jgi:hypothetical protein
MAMSPAPDELAAARIAVAMDYFRKVDAADPSLLDLMTDDIQLYFPKFGVGYGKAAVAESAAGFHASLRQIEHDFERMNIMTTGEHVIVEGFERGVTAEGVPWPDPERSEGRYCNVFEFHGLLIKRVHIYVDPDFTSTDRARFLWGDKVRRTRPGRTA